MVINFKHCGEQRSLGFTLIEVLIAMAILATISVALFGATSQIIKSKDLIEDRDEAYHSVFFAMEKMSTDLNMAYFIKSRDMLGTKFEGEIEFEGGEERLDFVSFSHHRYLKGAQEGDSSEISYYLVPDEEDPDSKILMRRESTSIDNNLQEGGVAYPLLEGVRRLKFEYLPQKNDEWKPIWKTKSIESGNQLPRAVKIELDIRLPEEEEMRTFSTIATIRMSNPISF